eukprot:9348636-Pyramimonas_sp.AAC.1
MQWPFMLSIAMNTGCDGNATQRIASKSYQSKCKAMQCSANQCNPGQCRPMPCAVQKPHRCDAKS